MRQIIFFFLTVLVGVSIYELAGGDPQALIQPFVVLLVLALVVTNAAGSGRIGVWGDILRHLFISEPETPERLTAMLAAVKSAETTAQVAGLIVTVLGLVHTMGALTEPLDVIGHLIGGSLVGLIIGLGFAHFLIAPIGAKLAAEAGNTLPMPKR